MELCNSGIRNPNSYVTAAVATIYILGFCGNDIIITNQRIPAIKKER